MSLEPARHRFTIFRGGTFDTRVQVDDEDGGALDLTGYTARFRVRETLDGPDALVLDSDNGISLGGVNGTIDLFLTDEATLALHWNSGVYNLSIIDPAGNANYVLYGLIVVRTI